MRQLKIALSLLLLATMATAQSTVEDFVREGIQHHEKGDYNQAIKSYKKALEIEPNSPLVHYEMALSYFKKEDYKRTIKHSDVVIDQKKEYILQAYLTKGSALDLMGKTNESIKLFKKAIKKMDDHYLLHYNLALNYYRINDLENAEKSVIEAIENNSNHASSHLMLAQIHHSQANSVQALLAVHYFLLLEPNSARSEAAYRMLQKNFGGNVAQDENKPNTINITVNAATDEEFSAAALMISLLQVTKNLEENADKTDDELFVENTESFFKMMGEMKDKNKGIWWDFYTPLFDDLARSEHIATYCKYITQSGNETARLWLDENEDQLTEFAEWLKTR